MAKLAIFLLALILTVTSYAKAPTDGVDRGLACWQALKKMEMAPQGWYGSKVVNQKTRGQFDLEMKGRLADHDQMMIDHATFLKLKENDPSITPVDLKAYEQVFKTCDAPAYPDVKRYFAELAKLKTQAKKPSASPALTSGDAAR